MKKRGFTLVELLAVIVILSVIGIVTIPMTLNYIEKSRKESYEISVNETIEAAKEYVIKMEENHDFPEGGIDVSKVDLKLENDKIISGVIKRNEEGVIVAENIYNGSYCASGSKNHIIVEKVESVEECKGIDTTPPELKIRVNHTTSTSITVVALAKDSLSEIKSYEYCIGDECSEEIEKNSYTFSNLKPGEKYEISVTVKNENSGKEGYEKELTDTTKKIEVTTAIVEKATFKVSTSSYAGKKEVTILYPEGEYQYQYEIFDIEGNIKEERKTVEEKEVNLMIEENCIIKAYVKYEEEVIENELYVVGIDQTGPIVTVIMNDIWEKTKQIKVIAEDEVGIATKGYSYDGGKTWTNNALRSFTKNQTIKLVVRDKLGNETDQYKICNGDPEKETTVCKEANEIVISKIDNVEPSCNLIVKNGTKGENGWYTSDVMIEFATIKDDSKDEDGKTIEGSGINSQKIDKTSINKDGQYTVKGTVVDKAGNEGTCELLVKVDKTKPSCGTMTISGTKGDNDWYIGNVTISKKDGSDSMSGHASTTLSHTSINSDTKGTEVKLTTKDKAGNVCETTKIVKVDKTKPSCGTINITGTKGDNNWYTSNVTISKTNGTDSTSGHASTTISHTSIKEETKGTTVTLTTKDKAGNECKTTKTVKVDKTKPSCSLKVKKGTIFADDWYKGNIEMGFDKKTDSTSGIASSSIDKTTVTAAGKTTVTGTVTDKAGNTATCKYTAKKSASKTVTLATSDCEYKGQMAYTGDYAYLGTYGYYITKSETFILPSWATRLKVTSYNYGDVQKSADWFLYSGGKGYKMSVNNLDKAYKGLENSLYFTHWTYDNAGTYCGKRTVTFTYYGD